MKQSHNYVTLPYPGILHFKLGLRGKAIYSRPMFIAEKEGADTVLVCG